MYFSFSTVKAVFCKINVVILILDTVPYLMVAGGYKDGEVLNSVEIVSKNPNKK
jgi:hypothetical protein